VVVVVATISWYVQFEVQMEVGVLIDADKKLGVLICLPRLAAL